MDPEPVLRRYGFPALAVLLLGAGVGVYVYCNPARATSTETLVRRWRGAWEDGDVDLLVDLQSEAPGVDRAALRREIERELAHPTMWSRASARATYLREVTHGDHIDVELQVNHIPAGRLVVVRDGATFKVHPAPEQVHAER